MRIQDLKRHLVPYGILRRRKTTINHAFAAAVAPCDIYDTEIVENAIRLLDQDPNSDLDCAYCDRAAETWDHVFATVRNSVFSGAGHRVGNLLPCCKSCNSRKGNKNWEQFLRETGGEESEVEGRIKRINAYLNRLFRQDFEPLDHPKYKSYLSIRDEILRLMQEADSIAEIIRKETTSTPQNNPSPQICTRVPQAETAHPRNS